MVEVKKIDTNKEVSILSKIDTGKMLEKIAGDTGKLENIKKAIETIREGNPNNKNIQELANKLINRINKMLDNTEQKKVNNNTEQKEVDREDLAKDYMSAYNSIVKEIIDDKKTNTVVKNTTEIGLQPFVEVNRKNKTSLLQAKLYGIAAHLVDKNVKIKNAYVIDEEKYGKEFSLRLRKSKKYLKKLAKELRYTDMEDFIKGLVWDKNEIKNKINIDVSNLTLEQRKDLSFRKYAQNRLEECINIVNDFEKNGKFDPEMSFYKIRALRQQGNFEQAISYGKKVLEKFPKNETLFKELGKLYILKNNKGELSIKTVSINRENITEMLKTVLYDKAIYGGKIWKDDIYGGKKEDFFSKYRELVKGIKNEIGTKKHRKEDANYYKAMQIIEKASL